MTDPREKKMADHPTILRSQNADVVVGRVYLPKRVITISGEDHPPQPMFIVRDATFEEWAACDWRNAQAGREPGFRYYEVSLD